MYITIGQFVGWTLIALIAGTALGIGALALLDIRAWAAQDAREEDF